MSRLRLALTAVLVLVVVVAVILAISVTALIRRPLPGYSGSVKIPGLGADVEVLRDGQGIPQVYADNAVDLFRAQGYVTAQDRFFQMDYRRHVTAGRLSELVGENEDALQADRVVRTLGWRRVAEAELPLLAPQTREYLQAYADGVNDYIAERSPSELSVAYTVLDARVDLGRIEPWDPVDSLAWLKAVAWDMRANYDDELGRALAYGAVGNEDQVAQLYPPYPYARNAPIIPAGQARGAARAQASRADEAASGRAAPPAGAAAAPAGAGAQGAGENGVTMAALRPAAAAVEQTRAALDAVPDMLGKGEGVGSNSWVISGKHTGTGKPLLANDPHLEPSVPSAWYQVGLHCRTVGDTCPFDVAGFSFAGLPGVVVGHNGSIAWGLTSLPADATDFFLERVNGDTYLRDGAQVPLEVRTEEIKVAGAASRTVTIRSTVHGPILSDVVPQVREAGRTTLVPPGAPIQGSGYEVSLSWTALTPGRSADAIFALDAARGWDEFRAAVALLEVPAQNVVYADTEGNIGYQAAGKVPVRRPGNLPGQQDGTWPRAGWDSAWDWAGYIPFDDLPKTFNPPEGFIVAANQAVTGPGYPYVLTRDFDYGYRSQRIRTVIEGWLADGHKITATDCRRLQMDTYNSFAAATLVPALLATSLDEGTSVPSDARAFTREAVDLLRDWDYREDADSPAAAYYNAVWSNLLHLTFADEPRGAVQPNGSSRWFEVVTALLADEQSPFWDDKRTPTVVEQRDQILGQSMYQARLELTAHLGKDPHSWRWGALHQLSLQPQLFSDASVPGPVRSLFGIGDIRLGGGTDVVDANAWDASVPGSYSVNDVPSMRMVLDLRDLDASTWVDLTGVSGHPWSPYYSDQTGRWTKGEAFPWPFSRKAVEEAESDRLVLEPAPETS